MSFDLQELNRRGAIALAAALATGTVAGGLLVPARASDKTGADKGQAADDDISATEDLMREHGVLRRALIVYAELASRLQAGRRDLNSQHWAMPRSSFVNLVRTTMSGYSRNNTCFRKCERPAGRMKS